MWLETKYATLISPLVRNFKAKSGMVWQFSCPICGDSQTRKHLARGYIYPKDNELRYTCHNCGINMSFPFFLKKLNPNLYKHYKLEKFKPKKFIDVGVESYKKIHQKESKKKGTIEELFSPLSEKANQYLDDRQISKRDDIFFISDISLVKKYLPNEDVDLPKDERIIFPIRNRKKEIVGISARSINPKEKMRYVLLKLKEEPLIFGLDKIDISKQVYVVEGAIDSLHLENAVAVNGSDLKKVSEIIPKENQILIFDNQPKNKEIIKKMLSACEEGHKLVIWPKNLLEKDINQMNKIYGIEKINEWLKNIYKGMACKMKIIDWKRI